VGAISTREHGEALSLLNAQYAAVTAGSHMAGGAIALAGRASQQAAGMSRQLMYQMVDIGQAIPMMLYSPIYALQNLGFQVAQIGQLYFGQGGMKAALRDMGSMALSAGRGLGRMAGSVLAIAAANPIAAGAIAATTLAVG